MSNFQKQLSKNCNAEQGFTLVTVLVLGLMMTLMGMALMIRAQQDTAISAARKDSGKGQAIAEGGVARTLALLKQPNNAVLLTRNYDPINPRTGKTYLGADSALNSGDEGGTAIDEWTGYNPSTKPCYQLAQIGAPNMPMTGNIGSDSYTLKAYRYDSAKHMGTVLVQGVTGAGAQSYTVAVSFSLTPNLSNFPGILVSDSYTTSDIAGKIALRGRVLLGHNANVYFNPNISANPALTGMSIPGDVNRPGYLDALYSGANDGAIGDTVEGSIVACNLDANVPRIPQGTNLGAITTSQSISGNPGVITQYRADTILLSGLDNLTVNTTNGPVYLYVEGISGGRSLELINQAKILNIRTDGQLPKVGDLRIFMMPDKGRAILRNQSCIQNAFLYSWADNLELYTDAPGCPGGRNTNFEGVVWAELVAAAKQDAANRNLNDVGGLSIWYGPDHNSTVIPGATSGIYVPNDVSSLTDLLPYINWPVQYQFNEIKSWKHQRL